ncbi:unnamed protein product [Closterium sp. NIES-64]|nr:unnamed protein product [Closterium sp. NIES-64]
MAPSAAPLPSAAAVEQHHESFRRCVDDWDSRVSVLTHQLQSRSQSYIGCCHAPAPIWEISRVNPHSSATPEFPSSNGSISSVVGGTIADQHEDGDAGEAGDSDAEDRGDREEREGRDGDGGSEESQEERHDSRGLGGPAEARGEGGTSKSVRPQGDDSEAGRDRSRRIRKNARKVIQWRRLKRRAGRAGSVVEEGREGTGGVEGEEAAAGGACVGGAAGAGAGGEGPHSYNGGASSAARDAGWRGGWEGRRVVGWRAGRGEADEGLQELLRSDWFKSTEYFTVSVLMELQALVLVRKDLTATMEELVVLLVELVGGEDGRGAGWDGGLAGGLGEEEADEDALAAGAAVLLPALDALAAGAAVLLVIDSALAANPAVARGIAAYKQSWKESAAWAVGPEAPPLAAAAKAGKGGKGGRAKASGGRQVLSGRALWRQQQKWLLPLPLRAAQHPSPLSRCIALFLSLAPIAGEGKGGGKAGAKGAGGKGGVKAVKGSAEKRGNGGESARGVREVCEDVLRGALDRANEDLPRLASAFPPLAASLSAALRLPLRLSLQCDSLEEAVGSQVKLVEQTLAVTCSARHQVQTLLELHASLRVSLKRRQIVLVAAVLQAIKQVESALAACLPSLSLHLPLYQQHLLRQLNAALLPLQVLSGSSQVFFPAAMDAHKKLVNSIATLTSMLQLTSLPQPLTQKSLSFSSPTCTTSPASCLQSFLRPLTRDVIADLHLHAISHSDLHSANPRFNPRKTGVRNLLQFLQLLPIRLLSRQIDIQAHVTQALAASLYNHTAAAPANWKLGEDVRQLAASKYRLLLPPIAIGGGLAFRLHSPPTSTSTASPALPFSILHPPSLAANLPFFVSAFSFDLSTLTFHQRPSSLASFHEPSSPTPSTRHADSSPAFSSHGPQSLTLRQLAALLQSTHAMLFLQHAATSACKLIAGKLSHLSRHASTLPAPPVAHSLAYCPSCSLMLFLVCPVESSEISRFPRPLPSSPSPLTLSPLSLASFPPFQELQASSHRPFLTLPAAIPPLSLILASKKQLAQQRRADAVAGGGRDGRVGDFCVDSHTLLFHTPSHLFQELQASPHRPFLTLPAAIPPLSLLLASKKQLAQQRLADAVAGGGRDGRVEGGRNDNGAGRKSFRSAPHLCVLSCQVANQRLTFESMDWFSLALHHLSFQRQAMPTNPPSTLTPAAAAAVGGGRGASAAGAVGAEKGKSGGGGADVGEEDDEEEEGEGTGGSGRGVTSLWSSWFGAAVAAAEPAASQPELSPELTHQLRQRERMLAGMAEQLSLMNVVTIAALRLFESSSAATQ